MSQINNEVQKYRLAVFFSNYFSSFGSIFVVNCLFILPMAIIFAILYFISNYYGGMNVLLTCLPVPLMSPFFAGVAYVCRKLTLGEKINPLKDYFKGIKENWLFFLLGSIMVYFVFTGIDVMYMIFSGDRSNIPVLIYFIIVLITSLIFILMQFSAMVMSVSVRLSYTVIIRNSFLLITKGFLNHIKTLFSLLFVFISWFAVIMMIHDPVIAFIVTVAIISGTLPVMIVYIIFFNSYQTVEKYVIEPYRESSFLEGKHDEDNSESIKEISVEELELLSKGDPEEYVSLHGKMLRRKTIIKMLEVRRLNQ